MKILSLLSLSAFCLGVAACSQPESQSKTDQTAMPTMSAAAPATASPITGVGVVTAIDAASGAVSLNHEAIAAIQWPAMSMQFRAQDPAQLQDIKVGDRVSFTLKSAAESAVITAIHKQ